MFYKRSILAGIFIGLAGFAYLSTGGVVGAILFAFGLTAVIRYELLLYTGKAGCYDFKLTLELFQILLLNLVGCFLVGLFSLFSLDQISENLVNILELRKQSSFFSVLVPAIGTGLIMEVAVQNLKPHLRTEHWLPLILGVPLFILCKMPHSVADAYYYSAGLVSGLLTPDWWILKAWVAAIIGNWIGCNIPRFFGVRF